MSQILKAKTVQESIKLLNFSSPDSIVYDSERGNKIISSDGKSHCVGCLNCTNPLCMNLENGDVDSPKFEKVSQDMNRTICPVNAITKRYYYN